MDGNYTRMTDLNFNIDKPDLPDERINKHKDFSKLMYNYQLATKPLSKTPLHQYKHRRIYLIILLVLLLMFIIIEVMDKEEQPQNPASQEQLDTPVKLN